MRSLVRFAFLLVLAFPAIAFSRSYNPLGDSYMFVRTDWHLAAIAEYNNDWKGAIEYYQKVIQESAPLNMYEREWYRGTGYYGIARCSINLGDTANVRSALVNAFEHHFWNFNLLRMDTTLQKYCSRAWIDSCAQFWLAVAQEEQLHWHEEKPIIYYPDGYDSSDRWPLIIAMHGGNGNYENFAEYWIGIASQLHAIIAVPPGVIRESEVTNSWESRLDWIEGPIIALAKSFTEHHLADPKQVYLAGFSQGAQSSMELTLSHPDIFHGAIALSGFSSLLFSDSVMAVAHSKGVRIYAISGEAEYNLFQNEIKQTQERCMAHSIPFQLDFLPGMTHEVPLDLSVRIGPVWQWVRGVSAIREKGE